MIPKAITQGGRTFRVQSRWLLFVQWIASNFGVTVSSAYRSPGTNSQAGGAENSDHLCGNAVDFAGSPDALAKLHAWAVRYGRFAYVEPMGQSQNHVHISFARCK